MKMKSHTEETAASIRRGERIRAMRAGEEIPHPETAQADARPGNFSDASVLAMLAGQAKRAALDNKPSPGGRGGNWLAANETPAGSLCLIGPTVRASYV